MGWHGYFSFGGTEIINAARTEAYAKALLLSWFQPVYKAEALAYMLGDGLAYQTPLQDEAPWVDPDALESLDFIGAYPLDVVGLEDSTRVAAVIESTRDGGTPGRLRHATKTVVFSVALLGTTEPAVEYGMRWLRRVLMGEVCSTPGGNDLCYFSAEPDMILPSKFEPALNAVIDGGWFLGRSINGWSSGPIVDGEGPGELLEGGDAEASTEDVSNDLLVDGGGPDSDPFFSSFTGGTPFGTGGVLLHDVEFWDVPEAPNHLEPEDCLSPYRRTLHKVSVIGGPSITARKETSDGGYVWIVQFTAVAGNPAEYGAERRVISQFLNPAVASPYPQGVTGIYDDAGSLLLEPECAQTVWEPLYDPRCSALIAPPGVPSVPLGCYNPPANWIRRSITIPASEVPTWGDVVPVINIHATTKNLRNLRVRFYADPSGAGDPGDDPCAFCGDFVVSYVPSGSTLVFDGVSETICVETAGGFSRRADSLVFGTDGRPFEWPVLTCGFGYVVTLDLPQTQTLPTFDLSLVPRAL